jgi:hypothetical protein
MLGPKFPARLLNQQDLAIDGVVHGVYLPLYRFLRRLAVVETFNCPHLLRMTLVGGRSFHNGKIVANAPEV